MADFRLTRQQMNRLKFRFEQFRNARLQVHRLMKEYIDDYKNFQGDSSDRQEYLEGKYIMLAPSHSHIKFDGEENVLWSPDDIALLTGRRQSTISRVILRMQRSPGWCSRLEALSVDSKSGNNNKVYIYRSGIFDLIFDKYEEEYLARYTRPRRGNSVDSKEVLRFWNYLKDSNFHDDYDSYSLGVSEAEQNDADDFPPMSLKDIAMLIFRKILTPKTGIIFPVIFAVTLAVVRRWPAMIPIFAIISVIMILACAVMIRTHRFRIGLASDIGAVALLCGVFLGVASFSDGVIYTPGGNAVELYEHERSIELYADMWRNGRVFFRVISDKYEGIKEVFFRVNEGEYKSTGFNEYHYPVLMIEPETQHGNISVEVKYIDARNKEYGPYKFMFDVDGEREKLKRKAENDRQEFKREKKEKSKSKK